MPTDSLKYHVLKHIAEGGSRLISPEFEVGERSGQLMSRDRSALLFTSAQSARSYLKAHNLEGFRAHCPEQRTGNLLAILACMDHCRNALVDGKNKIAFLSCYSGAYVLPGHFYRHAEGGYEVVQADDQWRPVTVDFSRPICGCGGLLGEWTPWYLTEIPLDKMFGVRQVIAGSCMRSNETGFYSVVRIDIDPPRHGWRLEVLIQAGDDENVISYDLSSQGLTPPDSEAEDVEPWDVCPVTGLVSVGIHPIYSCEGLASVELHALADQGSAQEGQVLATAKICDIPIIHPEQANADVRTPLEWLRL